VESLIGLLEREGALTSGDGDQAEFDAELAFERRARSFAQPAAG
jgi:hypothetical protein